MTFQDITILLPCHSLEDFPLHHEGEDAAGLLAAWTALWHPALIAAAGKMPGWARADDPPAELANRLIIVPQVSEAILLAGWAQRATGEGACVIRKKTDRAEIVQQALAALDAVPSIDPELAADFLALGYAYLQEELLTRQMRYISNLDQVHFDREVVAAAKAAAAGNSDPAREHLRNCFDVLTESREHVYPAEAFLIDLTLVAPTTLGVSLRQELSRGQPTNLLLAAELVQAMAEKEPPSLDAIRQALDRSALTLVGGELSERELPLLPAEEVLAELQQGQRIYRNLLGHAPEVYGRRRFGLSPLLPQLLSRLGFLGALHFTLDEGQFPKAEQCKSNWEGLDSSVIEAMSRVPLNIEKPESFLGLCQKIGQSMDMDHVATITFAHWPGKSSLWYDDLRRVARHAPVLGKFITLGEYFRNTASSGLTSRFTADQYRSPYLRQAIIRRLENPLSSVVSAQRKSLEETSRSGLAAMLAAASGKLAGANDDVATIAKTFATNTPRESGPAHDAVWVVNPLNALRREAVDVSSLARPPSVGGAVKAVQWNERKLALVEVPAMGYAWVAAGEPRPAGKEAVMADAKELVLRNEFFDVAIDEHTGALRSVRDQRHRGNRLSQQISLRHAGPRAKPGDVWRDPDETAIYSVMAADSVKVTSPGPVLGEIVAIGRLLDTSGKRLAGYRQTVQVWRGSRVIGLEIELTPDQDARADPWNSYYAARFAWAADDADLYRGVGLTRQRTELRQIESPLFVEMVSEKSRIAVLTGGLPYHRRVDMRMLDTMLLVRGESLRKFRLGVAIDHPHPVRAAVEWLSPLGTHLEQASPPKATSGSSIPFEMPGVLATHWEPLAGKGEASESSEAVGFSVRLQETEGKPVKAQLVSPRKPQSARQVNFLGETLAELRIEGETVWIDLSPFEWAQVEVRW